MESVTGAAEAAVSPDTEPSKIGYLEIFDREGKVSQRIPVTTSGMLLGRAYDNEVILDDPYVCPNHLRISWTGHSLIATDLDSTNGLWIESSRKPREAIIRSGTRMRIGRTSLRFCALDHVVAETLVDRSKSSPVQAFQHPLTWLAISAALIVAILTDAYLGTPDADFGKRMASEGVSLGVMLLMWSTFWAFGSRLVVKRWYYLTHWTIGAAFILASFVMMTLVEYAGFSLAIDEVMGNLTWPGLAGLVFGLLYLHIRFATMAARKRIVISAGVVTMVLFGIVGVFHTLKKDDFNSSPQFQASLKSPQFKMSASLSIQEFVKEAAKLAGQLDAQE